MRQKKSTKEKLEKINESNTEESDSIGTENYTSSDTALKNDRGSHAKL